MATETATTDPTGALTEETRGLINDEDFAEIERVYRKGLEIPNEQPAIHRAYAELGMTLYMAGLLPRLLAEVRRLRWKVAMLEQQVERLRAYRSNSLKNEVCCRHIAEGWEPSYGEPIPREEYSLSMRSVQALRDDRDRLRAENAELRRIVSGQTVAYPAGYEEALKVVEAAQKACSDYDSNGGELSNGAVQRLFRAVDAYNDACVAGQTAGIEGGGGE